MALKNGLTTRILCFIFLLVGLFGPASFVFASVPVNPPVLVGSSQLISATLSSKAVILVDKNSGKILFEKNSSSILVPASLVKVLAIEVILQRGIDLEGLLTVTKQDLTTSGVIVVRPGETFRVIDLIYASLISSDNTAIRTLVRSTGMSSSEFATAMTLRAQQMGATNTVAIEPVGLSLKNKTTALDMVRILSFMNSDDFYKSITSLSQYKFETKAGKKLTKTAKNTNPLFGDPSFNVLAGKTGTLPATGSNLAVLINDGGGREVYAVFLGAKNKVKLMEDVRRVVFWGWNNYSW